MKNQLADLPGGTKILEFDEIDSTSLEAMRRGRAGETGPLWILAGRQTRGRGRRGRVWQSDKGNFHASYLERMDCKIEDAAQISFIAAIALFDAVSNLFWANRKPSDLILKWPNDLLLDGKKLAGILTECTPVNPTDAQIQPGLSVVIGIGLNLAGAPDLPDRQTVSLRDCRLDISPHELLVPLAEQLERWLKIWSNGANIASILEEWQRRAMPAGSEIKVHLGNDQEVSGKIAGLSPKGELLIDQAGDIVKVSFGDVEFMGRDTDGQQHCD